MNHSTFYSQNFEDVILARCFSQTIKGFYIDVGAHLEEVDSVTKFFYDKGWAGINIEPVIEFANTFICRDRDTTICCAAGSEEKVLPMSISLDSGLSTFNTLNSTAIEIQGHTLEERHIQVRRLDSILEDLGIDQKSFEFLKIDVEGSELDVIKGINLFKYRPRVILCEVTEPNTTVMMREFGSICQAIELFDYQKIHFDGLNQWWCTKEAASELIKHFALPPCIFDSDSITPNSGTSARKQLVALSQRLNSVTKELDSVTKELDSVTKELNSVTNELNSATKKLDGIYLSPGWGFIQFMRKVKVKFRISGR